MGYDDSQLAEQRTVVETIKARRSMRRRGCDDLSQFWLWPRDGATVLERALQISGRACIFDQGRVVNQGAAQALLADREIQGRYCAV